MSPPTFRKAPSRVKPEPSAAVPVTGLAPRPGGTFQWAADSEFLITCLKDHVAAYFGQVMEPKAASHHAKHQTGRLMTDKEIEDAAVEITTGIIAELGQPYSEHMHRYFGDDEGMVGYVLTRVRNMLLERALQFNDHFLTTALRRGRVTQMTNEGNQ